MVLACILLDHGAGLLLKEKAESISDRKVHNVLPAVASFPGGEEQALPAKPGQMDGPLLIMLFFRFCSGSVPAGCGPQWD